MGESAEEFGSPAGPTGMDGTHGVESLNLGPEAAARALDTDPGSSTAARRKGKEGAEEKEGPKGEVKVSEGLTMNGSAGEGKKGV